MNKENEAYYAENCRICTANFAENTYVVKEKMFGFNDEFEYQLCSSCGCLQIAELPQHIEKYYPPYYYSFTQPIPQLKRRSFFKRAISDLRLKRKYRKDTGLLRYLKQINASTNHQILDVGCGKGQLICDLFNQGFKHVGGVDKFVPQEIDHGYGVKVLKKELVELPSAFYDIVMMHHVLEHIDQQQAALKDCYNLLKEDGCLLIRIPVIGAAWEKYKENWVQLDAPRHFFLHTLKSMEILAQQTGFYIKHTMFDSTAFQFMGSELYEKNIPLFSADYNYEHYPFEKMFSKAQRTTFDEQAAALNAQSKGDSAVFYLYKAKGNSQL